MAVADPEGKSGHRHSSSLTKDFGFNEEINVIYWELY